MSQTVTINNELLRINTQKNSIDVSLNGGRTWTNRYCMNSAGTFRDLLVVGDMILAATSKGLYCSVNKGMSWTARYVNSGVGEFLSLALSGTEVLATTSKGVYASRNQGQSWERRR